MKKENQQDHLENLTADELTARKQDMKQYFEESIPYLEAQVKYEKLLSDIAEFKFKRFQWDAQLSMNMYQMQNPEEADSEDPEAPVPERKLKQV